VAVSREGFWELKVHALLHDPPDKALLLFEPGWEHATLGTELARTLVRNVPQGGGECVKRADRLAAGADRANFLKRVETRFRERPVVAHPLSGEKIQIGELTDLRRVEPGVVHGVVERAIRAISERGQEDPRRAFHALWRLLGPMLARDREGEPLGPLWELLPADTRLPDHGVLSHMALTSAIAGCLWLEEGDPALLLLTFGPVQPFIEASRRIRDLWAASTVLAELALAAVTPIAESLGPDAVLFPWLQGQPRFDDWLEGRFPGLLGELRTESIEAVPTLPNRVLAVVPEATGPELARACLKAVRARWRQIAADARGSFGTFPDEFGEIADAQVEQHLELSWALFPWGADDRVDGDTASLRRLRAFFGGRLPEGLGPWLETAAELGREDAYPVNGGSLYGAAYEATSRLLDARKATRDFAAVEQHGRKCSLCGVREVVTDRPGDFRRAREFWRDAAGAKQLRPGEALCAVCLVKRFWSRDGQSAPQPSTSEVAVADFKLDILRRWETLGEAAQRWVEAVTSAGLAEEGFAVHAVWRTAGNEDARQRFARCDGEWLLGSARDEEIEVDPAAVRKIENAARHLIEAAAKLGIRRPRPYLAAIHMDGDQMGKWLSGALAPKFMDLLSPTAKDEIAGRPAVSAFLGLPRPLAPSTHGMVSRALKDFALRSVPQVMRGDGLPVHLVYAGGDDVLALAPLSAALEAARRVRLLFSGHVEGRLRGRVAPEEMSWERGRGFARDAAGPYLTMGREASMSAGIAIFHHRSPLGGALHAAREAEDFAKDVVGRNGFAMTVLRRSGPISLSGAPWKAEFAGAVADAPQCMNGVGENVRSGSLSPRFIGELRRFAARLVPSALLERSEREGHDEVLGLPEGAVRGQMAMIARAHVAPAADRNAIAENVVRLSFLAAVRSGEAPREPRTVRELRRAIDLIDAAVFMAREGVE
jgi:CRISPR-associated protein Cmr2